MDAISNQKVIAFDKFVKAFGCLRKGFDATGKIVRQMPVTNGVQQKINGVNPGTYVIRLAGQKDLVQVVLVQ